MLLLWKRGISTSRMASFRHAGVLQNVTDDLPVPKSSAYANKDTTDLVYIRKPRTIMSMPLPENFRLGYFPIYTAPATSYVSLIKRMSLSGSALGIYVSHLLNTSANFSTSLAVLTLMLSVIPTPIIQYFTSSYVTKIFRLYDKNKTPQTFENLTEDETLVFERMTLGGKRFYNELVNVNNLKLVKTWYGVKLWQHEDSDGTIRRYYVSDDLGGIKMDRIWGIVEKNSGIHNGRFE